MNTDKQILLERDVLEAVLLFHSASPWTEAKREQWLALTQTTEATTRVLCDTVRIALGRLPSCFGDFTGKFPSEIPSDMPLSVEQRIALERLGRQPSLGYTLYDLPVRDHLVETQEPTP